jgi:putative transposase
MPVRARKAVKIKPSSRRTNGKAEKFFDIFEKKVKFFNTVDEFMNWYNFIRPHGAFDIERLETPAMIFYKRLPKKEIIINHSLICWRGGVIICR